MAVGVTVAGAGTLELTTGLPSVTNFTVMGWFRLDADTNAYGTFLAVGENTAPFGYYINGNNTDGLTLIQYNNAAIVTGPLLVLNQWYHVAMSCAGTGAGQLNTYLNGAVAISQSGSATVSMESIRTGSTGDGNQGTNSQAALKVYSAVLTQTEIAREMYTYAPRRIADLVSWNPIVYPATLNYGTDLSGKNNHFVGTGTLAYNNGPPISWAPFTRRYPVPYVSVAAPAVAGRMLLLGVGR